MKLKLLFLLIVFNCFSQSKSLLDNIKIDNKTKLIGMYAQYDKNKTYQYLNFYIDDKNIIDSLISKLEYSQVVENRMEQNDFKIILLDGNKELNSWIISPMFKNIIVDGVYYDFDLDLIKDLSKKYPFNYTYFKKEFSNQEDFEKYTSKIGNEKNFLFAYEPFFEYEGSFEMIFPKNSEFYSPKMIDNFLRSELNKIAGENDFTISYILDERNLKNRNEFIITIQANKKIYKKLQLKNLQKSNWKDNQASGMFFMKST